MVITIMAVEFGKKTSWTVQKIMPSEEKQLIVYQEEEEGKTDGLLKTIWEWDWECCKAKAFMLQPMMHPLIGS